MPNQNARYPLVAIPKCMFDALQLDMNEDHDNPYFIVSVNEYVQTLLDHDPMYDYLLKMRVEKSFGETEVSKLVGDPTLSFKGDPIDMSLKRVRVTQSQYEMLQQRQAKYASDGLRIPVSCIVSSMLFQWSKSIRKALQYVPTGVSVYKSIIPEAWTFGDVNGSRCRICFHEKDENRQWQSFHYTSENGFVTPSVIVGWNPRRRALRDANLWFPEDE